MRIVGTLMVRDEVDIVAAMVEHHLAQDIDMLIVTDNASADGTTEVLEAYVETGRVELHHDPVHRKQQGTVVTGMARRARTYHRADWVLNPDADEFMLPVDRSLTLRDALEGTPLHLNAFTVPVTNLVGPAAGPAPASVGSTGATSDPTSCSRPSGSTPSRPPTPYTGASRTSSSPRATTSCRSSARPTADRGRDRGVPPPVAFVEQFELKVENAGRAYESNPDLRPSPNHHGMRDYRRHQAGRLREAYLARTPRLSELEEGARLGHYAHDEWLSKHLQRLASHALRPDLLGPVVDPANDVPVPDAEHAAGAETGRALLAAEAPVPARG